MISGKYFALLHFMHGKSHCDSFKVTLIVRLRRIFKIYVVEDMLDIFKLVYTLR